MRYCLMIMLAACAIAPAAHAQSGSAAPAAPPAIRPPEPILRQLSKDAVADGPVKEVRIFHDHLPPGAVTPWHSHPSSPIYYIISGSFTLDFKDRPSVVVHAGEGFVEPVGVVLRGRSAPDMPTEFVIVQVSPPTKPFLAMAAP